MKKLVSSHLFSALCSSFLLLGNLCAFSAAANISLQDTVKMAIAHDPWLKKNQLQEQSMRLSSEAASYLPDPKLSMGMLNLPTNGFAFNQEPMTQLKLGISQNFPRGDSLALRQQQLHFQAEQYPFQRADRHAKLKLKVSTLWLEAVKADLMIGLIKRDRVLFEQLVEIVNASYSAAQGNTRQQDVISAQLELARLDDHLTQVQSQRETALAQFAQYLSPTDYLRLTQAFTGDMTLPNNLELDRATQLTLERAEHSGLLELVSQHPAIQAIEQSVKAGQSAVQLAKQQYQPQWGINASYAYRDDNPIGQSRADFFSIGITLDMPLWGAEKQDSEVAASHLNAQSIETDKRLLLQQMLGKVLSLYRQKVALTQREQSYLSSILPQLQQQVDASLSAYTHDDGDFSEVMRARIAQLNGQIDLIKLQVNKQQKYRQLEYFLTRAASDNQQGDRL